jgi:hypothetical protein
MSFIEELAAVWRACEQDYRERVAQMDLREVYLELRSQRRMAAWCRMDGRGDGDIQYKIETLRARRDELGGGR